MVEEDTASTGEDSGSDSGGEGGGDAGGDDEPIREIPDDAIVTEEGTCHSAAVLAAADGAVFDEVTVLSYPHGLNVATMLGSAEDVANFQAAYGIELNTTGVNFETQSVLYAQTSVSQTCGPEEAVKHVVQIDGAAHLSLELWVPDATCDEVCDMSWTEFAAIVVQREPNLSACSRSIEFCE